MRPWLNWIEQQISNLWVAGSSPAGRARKNTTVQVVFFVPAGREPEKVASATKVRQRVDFANEVKQNRYECRAGDRASLLGAPEKKRPKRSFYYFFTIIY